MKITFNYSRSIEDRDLDRMGEQALWDAATEASLQYRLALIRFWSNATPKRRADAKKNLEALGESR